MSLPNTADNEKRNFIFLGITSAQMMLELRENQRAWSFSASPSSKRQSCSCNEWAHARWWYILAGPEGERESHLPFQDMQGQMVAGMGVPCQCHPESVPTCCYQLFVPVMQQAQGRPSNQLVQMRPKPVQQQGGDIRASKECQTLWARPCPTLCNLASTGNGPAFLGFPIPFRKSRSPLLYRR